VQAVTVEIVPIERRYITGFRAVLDSVAREGRYLAVLEAPAPARIRRFVLNNLRSGAPQFVALDAGRVVGWCDITPKTHSTLAHCGVLGMGVASSHRGQGVGARLMDATTEAALARGMTRIELTVRADNGPAIALYRRFGFEAEGLMRRYLIVDGLYYDALMMARVT